MAKNLDKDNWDEIAKDFFLTHAATPSPTAEGGER